MSACAAAVRPVKIKRITAHIKPVAQIAAAVRKITFSRTNLADGYFMMNYYFARNAVGELVEEDVERATHVERAVFDRDGNLIGSTIRCLDGEVRW